MQRSTEFTQFGKYLLLQKIAVGGMAEIFLAKQAGLAGFEKLVVIKRILPELTADKEFVNMFLDEARLAASMMHANIAQVFDLDRVGDSIYIAMEYVPGQDLAHLIRACRVGRRQLPPELLARIVAATCEGLHYAHTLKDSHGRPLHIVHRDVTPSNILVAYEGAVKVLDFGVARAESQLAKTSAGKIKGKFPYLAPEQVRMDSIDAQVDVWALGVVLWESLTGRRLFGGDNELAILKNILERPVLPPSTFNPGSPPALDAIALRALQRDRSKRYPTAQAMQQDLERFLSVQKMPATTMDVSSYVKQLFTAEFAAYERLLREIPHATPEQLADLAKQAEPGRTPSHSGSSEMASNPAVTPPPTSHKTAVALAVAAAALLVGVGASVAWLRHPAAPEVEPVGMLSIISDPPGATIYFDGTQRLVSPATVAKVTADAEHVVIVEKDGYDIATQTVKLAPRAHRELLIQLKRKLVKLAVTSDPPGARLVRADSGDVLGITPVQTTVPASRDELVLRLELDRYRPVERKVSLAADVAFDVSLIPAPAAPTAASALTARKKPKQEATDDGVIDPFDQ